MIRHRFDAELHRLTLRSLEADTEVRVEVNLDPGHHAGDHVVRARRSLLQILIPEVAELAPRPSPGCAENPEAQAGVSRPSADNHDSCVRPSKTSHIGNE
jgi:hypothetical protein